MPPPGEPQKIHRNPLSPPSLRGAMTGQHMGVDCCLFDCLFACVDAVVVRAQLFASLREAQTKREGLIVRPAITFDAAA